MVTLAINGTFSVKPSPKGAVVEVHTDGEQALLDLGLRLGQTVSVRTRRQKTSDRLEVGTTNRDDLMGLLAVLDDLG